MLHRHAGAAHLVEPVDVAAEVNAGVAPSETHVAIFLRRHHVKLFLYEIERHHARVGGVYSTVPAAFLRGDDDDTVRSARAVDG